jgi:protein-S-isoprenylcysteine O-methyltransferase Ste14
VVLLFLLGGVFLHFMLAGARTFHFKEEGPGAVIAQLMFIGGGTMLVWYVGLEQPIQLLHGIAAALVLALAVGIYEWARHTIWGRRFGVALDDHVPEALCEAGPYRFVRHPIYLGYLLAFLAAWVALPHWMTALSFAVNAVLCVLAARDDERRIAVSPLAADYAAYRQRTGMFLPRPGRASSAAPGR